MYIIEKGGNDSQGRRHLWPVISYNIQLTLNAHLISKKNIAGLLSPQAKQSVGHFLRFSHDIEESFFCSCSTNANDEEQYIINVELPKLWIAHTDIYMDVWMTGAWLECFRAWRLYSQDCPNVAFIHRIPIAYGLPTYRIHRLVGMPPLKNGAFFLLQSHVVYRKKNQSVLLKAHERIQSRRVDEGTHFQTWRHAWHFKPPLPCRRPFFQPTNQTTNKLLWPDTEAYPVPVQRCLPRGLKAWPRLLHFMTFTRIKINSYI